MSELHTGNALEKTTTGESAGSNTKTKETVKKPSILGSITSSSKDPAKSKSHALKLRFSVPKTTNKKSQGLPNSESKTKAATIKRRHKPRRFPKDRVFEEPPKIETETNTDSTHDEHSDEAERSSSSFQLLRDPDLSDKECDSSSSTGSGSGTQKTEGGILENERGDKVINASRLTFFGILGVSAVVIAFLAHYLFRLEETKLFQKQVCLYCICVLVVCML
jgi:cobalamin biosynthesis Mg chelatase CobN